MKNENRENILEAARRIPVARETDVLVCGGGPAGIAAAVTAAREGARVLIVERHPFLGGVWTAGALAILIDTERKAGFNAELRRRLHARGGVTFHKSEWPEWPIYGLEAMKGLLDEIVAEEHIDVQLYTHVVAVAHGDSDDASPGSLSGGDSRITGVFTESKSGREFVRARIVIDTTGDGDVAALAGCPFDMGRPGDGKVQPMTLYGRVGGYRGGPVHIEPLRTLALRAGFRPSYERITLFPQPGQPGVFMLMATHLYGSGIDARNLTRAEFQGRKEIRELVSVLRAHGGPDWRDAYLIDTGPFVGIREARRIRGRYTLSAADLAAGRRFHDGICQVRFVADIHHPDPGDGAGLFHEPTKPYDIPYRSLLAAGHANLLLAGRCISGDHVAHASYRVTGDAVATGEAAGLAAALSCRGNTDPADIDIPRLLTRLAEIRDRHPPDPVPPRVTSSGTRIPVPLLQHNPN
ncbi:FAD binding protein [Opitutaceae bacterium TAV1]|nr:FAD binding protein [Opitutaceae bacterium TAV1]